MNNSDGVEGAVVFDDTIPFAQRIEIEELVRQSDYTLVEIEEEEYNSIPRKFAL
jgi:hypothetical protein